jgi:hypothetical protein
MGAGEHSGLWEPTGGCIYLIWAATAAGQEVFVPASMVDVFLRHCIWLSMGCGLLGVQLVQVQVYRHDQ